MNIKNIITKMIIKNSQLDQNTIEAINEMIDMEISALSAFKLVKMVKQLDEIVKAKTKSEVALVQKFAKKDDGGEIVLGKDEDGKEVPNSYEIIDIESFQKEMTELMDYDNEIAYEPIKIEDLGLVTVKVKNLLKLEFLFEI